MSEAGITWTEHVRRMLTEKPDRVEWTISRVGLELLTADSERYAQSNILRGKLQPVLLELRQMLFFLSGGRELDRTKCGDLGERLDALMFNGLAQESALSTPSEVSEPVADESGGEGEKCAHCDGSGHGFTSSVCWACKGSGAPTTPPNPTNGDAVSEPEAIGGGEGERQWPDIGHDPMKAARPDDRYEASRAALREAYQRQQPHVPNQTALVWRWHLGAVLEMATRLQAITSRGAATPQPVSGDAVREALEAGRIVVEGRGNGTYDEAVEAICKLLAALNHGGTQ